MTYKILVVEDDKDLAEGLRELLLENGFLVEIASQGSQALKKVEASIPDLVILDLGLPDISGETVCQELKKYYPELPIIILTAKNTTADVVRGLNIGADDFMAKPFELDELLARIKARLRGGGLSASLLKIDDLELDSQKIEVKRSGQSIHLTQTEFKLL
ncbi:MAG: response regulator transcription factor [Candidatus Curtissbacteria bacterium]|nr:response regulator transcription factor [Candidatus Curtissbacteria bacterium]